MKIERSFVPESTLEDFAAEHGLTMEVHERGREFVRMSHIGPGARFYAHFKNCDISDGYVLRGAFGDGATEGEAIANYAKEISECRLVIDSGKPSRREIQAPRIRWDSGEQSGPPASQSDP